MQIKNQTSLKDLTYQINGAAIEVHKSLGPGLLESVYHQCMKHELQIRGIKFVYEMIISIEYKDIEVETNLRCDLFVEKSIVVELKAVAEILPIHEAQLLTYMKLLNAPKGILFNFNCFNLYSDGQKTFVNEFFRALAE
jgi:GxxExxY protein